MEYFWSSIFTTCVLKAWCLFFRYTEGTTRETSLPLKKSTNSSLHPQQQTHKSAWGERRRGKYFLILDAGNKNSKQPHKKPEEIRKPWLKSPHAKQTIPIPKSSLIIILLISLPVFQTSYLYLQLTDRQDFLLHRVVFWVLLPYNHFESEVCCVYCS